MEKLEKLIVICFSLFTKLSKFFRKIRRYTISPFLVLLLSSALIIINFSIIEPYFQFNEKSGSINMRYEELGDFYKNLSDKVNEFRGNIAENDEFERWQRPAEPIVMEFFLDDISRINEQRSTIRLKGSIAATWNPDKSINEIYFQESQLFKDFKSDVLQNSNLNFASTEEQLFQKVYDQKFEDGSKKVIYRFEGEFPLLRNLTRFPFDNATWQIRIINDIPAASFTYLGTNSAIQFPSSNVNSYRFDYIDCYGESTAACTRYELKKFNTYPQEAYSDSNHENYINASMDYGLTMATSGKLERSRVSSFTRYLLPIIFGMLVLSMTDQLSSKEAWEIRVAIPPTVLLTLIFMQNSYHSQLPQLAYLTWLDQIYLISYFSSILMLFNAIINKGDWFNTRIIDSFVRLRITYLIRTTFTFLTVIGPIYLYFADYAS